MARAKFVVASRFEYSNGFEVTLRAVTGGSKESEEFFHCTPSALIKLATINPGVAAQFKPGLKFYVDFTETND